MFPKFSIVSLVIMLARTSSFHRRLAVAASSRAATSYSLFRPTMDGGVERVLGVSGTTVSSPLRRNNTFRSRRTLSLLTGLRGGDDGASGSAVAGVSSKAATEGGEEPESLPTPGYTKLADPAPGSPFHYAFPVHDLSAANHFYGTILGCEEGRSSTKWQDFSLHGHQIVCHYVGADYRCIDYYNPVDGDEVPVPHAGLALTLDQFHALADRLREAGCTFVIEPHLRFKGMPGEQWTMFLKDPSGNNLEFKSMAKPENLFAKYNVADS